MSIPRTNPVLCGSIAGRPGAFGVAMHNAAYRALGLNFAYVAFGCDDTQAAVAAMRALGLRGLGVTTPHKERIAAYLDRLTDDARAIGAVNTVINDDGVLTGHNVDWLGAVAAVREIIEPAGQKVAVIGAGGGARAIIYGLAQTGAYVSVFNRTAERGQALAQELGVTFVGAPSDIAEAGPFALIAHATRVGFHDPQAILLPADTLVAGTVVFDAVAVPIRTRLLIEAEARGCPTIPGVRMQLHQAVHQFHLYTGLFPDPSIMEKALLDAMNAG